MRGKILGYNTHIDFLVDNTAQHKVFSFMDGFSGYSQIKMAPEDMEKTTFITQWGTFCYKVMSFGLKNAGATYQRVMVALFHDMIHHEIEVYVDDMIARSHVLASMFLNLLRISVSPCIGVMCKLFCFGHLAFGLLAIWLLASTFLNEPAWDPV